jgi:hypothetical protein
MTLTERRANAALAALCLLFLAVNLGTATRYPLPWVDEIQFADPAINLVLRGHFSSTVWIAQNSDGFWAGNAPLYTFLLSGWLRVFGVSPLSVRSLNFLLMTAAVCLIWELVRRNKWIANPSWRLLLCLLLMTGQGLTFSYRMGRYDVLGINLFALAALIWSGPASLWEYVLLAAVAALMPLAGLQLVAAAAVYCAILFLFLGRNAISRIIAVGVGLVTGGAALYLLYTSHGVWQAFRASTSAVGTMGQDVGSKLLAFPAAYANDKSLLLLLLAGLLIAILKPGQFIQWDRNLLPFSLTVALVTPVVLSIGAKFPLYYAWMAFIPLAIAVVAELSKPGLSSRSRGALSVLLLLAGLVGLPLRLTPVVLNWNARSLRPIGQFVDANLRPSDSVVADFKAYYAVKLHCRSVYAPTYVGMMKPNEREGVTALLVRPSQLALVTQEVGGQWRDTGLSIPGGEIRTKRLLLVMKDVASDQFTVELYRRDEKRLNDSPDLRGDRYLGMRPR